MPAHSSMQPQLYESLYNTALDRSAGKGGASVCTAQGWNTVAQQVSSHFCLRGENFPLHSSWTYRVARDPSRSIQAGS